MDGWDLRGIAIGIAWDVNPLYFTRFQKSASDGPERAVGAIGSFINAKQSSL